MIERLGKYTLKLNERPSIIAGAGVVGKTEGDGPLKEEFDRIFEDDTLGEESFEKAESSLQREAVLQAMIKSGKPIEDVEYIFAGDLLNQCTGSSYGLKDFYIPFLGIYGACSTFAEGLLLSAAMVNAGYADNSAAVTSSRPRRSPLSAEAMASMRARFPEKTKKHTKLKSNMKSALLSRFLSKTDSAAASIMEGSIILMVDNSPSVMILPTTFFDFTQEANEFYFPPLVGSYLRLLRIIVFLISLLITPMWYLMVSEPGRLPSWLEFLSSPEPASLGLLWQLLVVEFLVDVLKLASLNTPDSLSNSFSMLGALILGDFAVQAGWLGPEVLVYMAFVSVASFAQPSYEMGYAFKLLRVALLLVTAAFDVWGFVLGITGILVLLATTKPVVGKGYLYPLIPFNGKTLRRLLLREPISRDNT